MKETGKTNALDDFIQSFKSECERQRRERELAEKPFNDFVTGIGGFVDPEKVEAVMTFGLEKAQKMWANGKEPDWKMRDFLQKKSCIRALTYHKCKGEIKRT